MAQEACSTVSRNSLTNFCLARGRLRTASSCCSILDFGPGFPSLAGVIFADELGDRHVEDFSAAAHEVKGRVARLALVVREVEVKHRILSPLGVCKGFQLIPKFRLRWSDGKPAFRLYTFAPPGLSCLERTKSHLWDLSKCKK